MKKREILILVAGILIGVILGMLAREWILRVFSLSAGAFGYLLALAALIAFGLIVVISQDLLETIYRQVERQFSRKPIRSKERQQEEKRLPVNPWGWPNPFIKKADRENE